jgi:hypothetical protein
LPTISEAYAAEVTVGEPVAVALPQVGSNSNDDDDNDDDDAVDDGKNNDDDDICDVLDIAMEID